MLSLVLGALVQELYTPERAQRKALKLIKGLECLAYEERVRIWVVQTGEKKAQMGSCVCN